MFVRWHHNTAVSISDFERRDFKESLSRSFWKTQSAPNSGHWSPETIYSRMISLSLAVIARCRLILMGHAMMEYNGDAVNWNRFIHITIMTARQWYTLLVLCETKNRLPVDSWHKGTVMLNVNCFFAASMNKAFEINSPSSDRRMRYLIARVTWA